MSTLTFGNLGIFDRMPAAMKNRGERNKDEGKAFHTGNANIIANGGGAIVHPVGKTVRRFLHKIR